MVSLVFKGAIILTMITCGAINTVGNPCLTPDYKFQNTQYVFEGPFYKYFFHPYVQVLPPQLRLSSCSSPNPSPSSSTTFESGGTLSFSKSGNRKQKKMVKPSK